MAKRYNSGGKTNLWKKNGKVRMIWKLTIIVGLALLLKRGVQAWKDKKEGQTGAQKLTDAASTAANLAATMKN